MRRENRRIERKDHFKNIMYISGAILGVLVIAFVITFSIYANNVKKNNSTSMLNTRNVSELVPNREENENTQTASTEMGKTVNEMAEIQNTTNVENQITESETIETDTNTSTSSETTEEVVEETENVEAPIEEEKKELVFEKPVDGEISVAFAKDSLVYSETLQEWITHKGIDIKADKTTIVKAAEAGTVQSIKNDPRYGLTIIVEHEDGYKTVYASLLTSEFVVEGEKVEKGQTLGTVGTSAIFESSDGPHLHFELLKDDEYLDPSIYLK